MLLRAPKFWESRNTTSLILYPFSLLYSLAATARYSLANPASAGLPVICIGNLTVGGTGKTPVAIEIAYMLAKHDEKPFFLTRGYGARIAAPTIVDLQKHSATDVGDESLLLANHFPTVVSPNRALGAELCKEKGATVIVMDDGLQNPSIRKTLSLAVIDGTYGFGNRLVIPAGPLREPLTSGFKKISTAIIFGDASSHHIPSGLRTIKAAFIATAIPENLKSKRLLAFAGIGRPQKFFDTLKVAGLEVALAKSFPDHFQYQANHIAELLNEAEKNNLELVTTEKDFVKIPLSLRNKITPFPVRVEFENKAELEELVIKACAKKKP